MAKKSVKKESPSYEILEAFVLTPPPKPKVEKKNLASTGETQALPMYKEPTFVDDCLETVDRLTKGKKKD